MKRNILSNDVVVHLQNLISEKMPGITKGHLISLSFHATGDVVREYLGYYGDIADMVQNKVSKKRAFYDLYIIHFRRYYIP